MPPPSGGGIRVSRRGRRADDPEPLGRPGQRHVQVVGPVRGPGHDALRVDDQDRVELQALRLPGVEQDHRPGEVGRRTVRGVRQGGDQAGKQLRRGDHGGPALVARRGGHRVGGLLDRVVDRTVPGLHPGGPHRARRLEARVVGPPHLGRDGHDLGRRAVVDPEPDELPAVVHVRGEDPLPGADARRVAGLGRVADQGHRAVRAAAHEQPPGHRGEFLGLVDDDVPEGPGAVGGGPFRGGPVVGLLVPLGEAFGVDDVVGGENLGGVLVLLLLVLELVGARGVGDVEDALRVLDLLLPFGLLGGAGGRVVRAEELGGLVEQRHVGGGPGSVPAPDRGGVRVGQVGGLGQVVREEVLRGEIRPEGVDRRVDVGVGGDALGEQRDVVGAEEVGAAVGVGADAVGELFGERVQDPEDEVGAGQVVREGRLAGLVAGLQGHVPVDDQVAVLVRDDQRLAALGDLLTVPYGRGERLRHGGGALDGGGAGGVGAGGADAGEQFGGGGEEDAGLAEGGQDVADVAEERGVGADDEHGPLRELLAVRVEEVRGPVQGDRRLAGAGAALDDEDPSVRGADDGVLLGLDGLHDVVHPPGAGGVERGEQHLVGVTALVSGAGGVAEVEHLVVERGDRAAEGADVPAAGEPHRLVSGGEVEGAGDLGAPVDDERGAVRVVLADAEPADVVVAPVLEDETPETEPALPALNAASSPDCSATMTSRSSRPWLLPTPGVRRARPTAASASALRSSSRE